MNYFKLKRSTDKQYYFVLLSRNNKVILTSELYKTEQGLRTGINSVRANAGNRNNYEIRKAINGQPYFLLKAQNGEIIGSSETYSSSQQLENGIKSVRFHAGLANTVKE
ncbi:MAG: YegP family protein [Flavobacteriaceae bacterium]|nr:YegP family protein [Flavobacteriaceae bacterium]